MEAAGVPYAVGREPRSLYGEAWAGRQPATRPGKHNFRVVLSPFDAAGALFPHIREPQLDDRGWPADALGEGDGGLQAYAFRRLLFCRGGIAALRAACRLRPATSSSSCDATSTRRRTAPPSSSGSSRPASERQVRRQLDRPVLAQRARRQQPRLSGRRRSRPRAGAGAPPPLHAVLPLLPRERRRGAGADPRRASTVGALRRRVHGQRRLAAPALRPRRPPHARRVVLTSTTCWMRARSPTPSRYGRTTSTCARSSAPGGICRSTCGRRRSSTRATCRLPSRRIRSRCARSGPGATIARTSSSRCASPPRTSRSARCGWSRP